MIANKDQLLWTLNMLLVPYFETNDTVNAPEARKAISIYLEAAKQIGLVKGK